MIDPKAFDWAANSAAPTGRTDGGIDQHRITVTKPLAKREPSTDGYTLPTRPHSKHFR